MERAFNYLTLLFPILIFLSGIPLALRLVPPNPIYGYRTARTFSDERVWYDVNAFLGYSMTIFGGIATILAIYWLVKSGFTLDWRRNANYVALAAAILSLGLTVVFAK